MAGSGIDRPIGLEMSGKPSEPVNTGSPSGVAQSASAEGTGTGLAVPPGAVVDGYTPGALWSPSQSSIAVLEADARKSLGNAIDAFRRGEYGRAVNLARETIEILQRTAYQSLSAAEIPKIQTDGIAAAELEAVASARLGEADAAVRMFSIRVNTIFPPPQFHRQVRAWWRFAKTLMSFGMKAIAESAYRRALTISLDKGIIENGTIAVADAILVDWAARLINGYDADARVVITDLIGLRSRAGVASAWNRAGDPEAARLLLSYLEQAGYLLPNKPEGGRFTPTDPPVVINSRMRGMAADLLARGFAPFAAKLLSRLASFQLDTGQPEASDTVNAACGALGEVIRIAHLQQPRDKPTIDEAIRAQTELRALQAVIPPGEHPSLSVSTTSRAIAAGDAAMSEGKRRMELRDPKLPASQAFERAANAYEEAGNCWRGLGNIKLAVEAYTRQAVAIVAARDGSGQSVALGLEKFLDYVNLLFPDRPLALEAQVARAQRADAIMGLGRNALAAGYSSLAISAMTKATTLYKYFQIHRTIISALVETASVYTSLGKFDVAMDLYREAYILVRARSSAANLDMNTGRAVVEPAVEALSAFIRVHQGQRQLISSAEEVLIKVKGMRTPPPSKIVRPPPHIRNDPPVTPATTGQSFYDGKSFNQAMFAFETEANNFAARGDLPSAISAMVKSVRAGILADFIAVRNEIDGGKGIRRSINPGSAGFALRRFDQFLKERITGNPESTRAAVASLRYMLGQIEVVNRLDAIRDYYALPDVKVGGEVIKIGIRAGSPPSGPSSGGPPASAGGVPAGGASAAKAGSAVPVSGKGSGSKARHAALAGGALQIGGLLGTTYAAAAANMAGWLSDEGLAVSGLGSASIAFYAFPIVGPLVVPAAGRVTEPFARLADEAALNAGIENPYERLGARVAGGGAAGVAFFALIQKVMEAYYGVEKFHNFEIAARTMLNKRILAVGDVGLAVEAKIAAAGSRVMNGGRVLLSGAKAASGSAVISLLAMFLGGGFDPKEQIYLAMGAEKDKRLQEMIEWAMDNGLAISWGSLGRMRGEADVALDERAKKFLALYYDYAAELSKLETR